VLILTVEVMIKYDTISTVPNAFLVFMQTKDNIQDNVLTI